MKMSPSELLELIDRVAQDAAARLYVDRGYPIPPYAGSDSGDEFDDEGDENAGEDLSFMLDNIKPQETPFTAATAGPVSMSSGGMGDEFGFLACLDILDEHHIGHGGQSLPERVSVAVGQIHDLASALAGVAMALGGDAMNKPMRELDEAVRALVFRTETLEALRKNQADVFHRITEALGCQPGDDVVAEAERLHRAAYGDHRAPDFRPSAPPKTPESPPVERFGQMAIAPGDFAPRIENVLTKAFATVNAETDTEHALGIVDRNLVERTENVHPEGSEHDLGDDEEHAAIMLAIREM